MRKTAAIGIMMLTALALNAAQKNGTNSTTYINTKMENNTTATAKGHNLVKVTCIRDNKEERTMPLSLFGNVPGNIVNSLGISGGIPASMNAFLIKSGNTVILFDTGLGTPDSQLMTAIDNKPEDIKYIYLTHLHGDHIGGMMKDGKPVFTNAQVYISRLEYEAWMNMTGQGATQAKETMKAYKTQLHLFEFGDTLPGNVTALDGRGHTPGHTVYDVCGQILVAGDIMHGKALQMRHPEYCASYDMDKENAVKTRIRIMKYAAEHKMDIAGMHIPQPGIISFK